MYSIHNIIFCYKCNLLFISENQLLERNTFVGSDDLILPITHVHLNSFVKIQREDNSVPSYVYVDKTHTHRNYRQVKQSIFVWQVKYTHVGIYSVMAQYWGALLAWISQQLPTTQYTYLPLYVSKYYSLKSHPCRNVHTQYALILDEVPTESAAAAAAAAAEAGSGWSKMRAPINPTTHSNTQQLHNRSLLTHSAVFLLKALTMSVINQNDSA